MKAVTWQGRRNIQVGTVPDPRVQSPTDAVVRLTSTAICGSDLHLYEVLTPWMDRGDVLGHEGMGVVEEVGSAVASVHPGSRVVIPFNVACGSCPMCAVGLYSQCETTQQRQQGTGGALLGYSRLYGSLPGAQAERVRVPYADAGLIPVGQTLPDERYLFLSDILPTAWQAVAYADVGEGGTLVVVGLGPVGQLAGRVGKRRGARVFGIEPVPERRAMAARHGVEAVDVGAAGIEAIRDATDGRGPDAVIDAVGMEAHGAPVAALAQRAAGMLPAPLGRLASRTIGLDRTAALRTAVGLVRRGGTLSLSGVYGGAITPIPMRQLFDKQIQVRMGQCNVRRWTDDLLPLVEEPDDPLGVSDLTTHRLPLEEAPAAYAMFQHKTDGCVKVVLQPTAS